MPMREKNRRRLLLAVGMTVVIIIVIGMILGANYYIDNMRQAMWLQSVTDVLEISEQGAHAFEVYINQGFAMLEGRASNFAQYASFDQDAIENKLDLYEDGDPTFVVIDLTNRMIYFNSRESMELPEDEAEMYLTLPDRGLLEPYLNEKLGLRMIGYYERFQFSDGALGMVRKGYLLSDVAEEFSLSFFDDTGFSYIVNSSGDIVIRPDNPNSNRTFSNIFDVLEMEGNAEEDNNAFKDAMENGKQGAMRLYFDNEECVFTFVPVRNAEGWYTVSIIPSESISARTEELLNASQMFIFIMALTIFLFLIFVIMLRQYHHSMKAKDAEVKYREQLFSILTNSTNEAFLMLSGDGVSVEYASPNLERVTGIPKGSPSEAYTKHLGMKDLLLIPHGESVIYDEKIKRESTGEEYWVEERIYRSSLNGTDRFIIVFSDRTEDRKREYALTEALDIAQAANQSKSAFLSNMSHDIRTPMNAIVGLSTLLQRDAENPDKVREHTRKITASSQHLLGLINDVLDMSKIESGKTTINMGEIDLAEIIEELGTIMRPQAKAKQQKFEVYIHDLTDEHVLGDRLRINQVLINILSNAVKYTPEGGKIEFTVEQIPYSVKGFAHIRFHVKDNGIGMSEEYLKHIFDPFSRSEDVASSGIQGTGLGMAITKNLVDLMGGSITVESELGKGSLFTLDLELQIVESNTDADFWQDNKICRVLVVDDEVDICTAIMAAMANTGVELQYALDGMTAVRMAERALEEGQEYDIILLDWKMPIMDGLATSKRIHQVITNDVPFVILTSYDYSDIEEESRSAGIDAFLPKPFFLGSLKEVVRTLRAKSKLETNVGKHDEELKGRNFLAAEDNELNAEILEEMLGMMDAKCEIMSDGKAVCERFEASEPNEFDAILMDIQMPVMNGYEAARAIRSSSHPNAKTIPIIAMTANAFAEDVAKALDAGMDAHISKPVDIEKMGETLKRILEEKKA